MTTELPTPPGFTHAAVGSSLHDWLVAGGCCAAAFGSMWAYHDWWRAKPYSVATANESLALAAVVGLSALLALAPLRLLSGKLHKTVSLEHPLLVTAGLCALLHIAVTMLLLQGRYDRTYYAAHWDLVLFGASAAALLALLCVASAPAVMRRLAEPRRRSIGPCSCLVLVLVLAHFMVLGKVSKWIDWAQTFDRPAPPGTMPIFILALAPLVLRLLTLRPSRER